MKLTLKNVRLSYPSLWKAKASQDRPDDFKFSASLLLDKTACAEQIKQVRAAILAVAGEKWNPQNVKWDGDTFKIRIGDKGAIIKTCLRDGAEKGETDGYGDGVKFIGASNKVQPKIVDRNPAVELFEKDGRPYAGCVVNASLRLWVQDNQYGKRVNAELKAIQFVADGEPFGDDAPIKPTEEFENLSSGEPADQDGFTNGGGGDPDTF